MDAKKLGAVMFAMACLAGCAAEADDAEAVDANEVKSMKGVTAEERKALVKGAGVAVDDDIEKKDLLAGPGKKFAMNEEVACDFVEPSEKGELNGKSPKFQCKLANGDVVKVKYGNTADDNGEIYGEVMATRLMWGIGFAADKMYPVRVTCAGCPENPWKVYQDFSPGRTTGGERTTRRFEHAVIETKFDGAKIEQEGKPDQGWNWGEIGDAPDRNALKLLGAFMKHADNKPENQRLVCPKDNIGPDGKCTKAVLMIQDAGVTFGGAARFFGLFYDKDARARYNDWISLPVWKDRGDCRAELRDSVTGTMTHPQIFESGRAYLAARMARLTDKQITDLFTASRVVERGEETDDIRVNAPSKKRKVTVDDWRIAFKLHRDEITKHTCPR